MSAAGARAATARTALRHEPPERLIVRRDGRRVELRAPVDEHLVPRRQPPGAIIAPLSLVEELSLPRLGEEKVTRAGRKPLHLDTVVEPVAGRIGRRRHL